MRFLLLALLILGAGLAAAQAADDCPNVQSAGKGFIVERGERSKTEVFYAGDTDVRTVYRIDGQVALEVTLFQGLFELERVDRGKRMAYRPISDLAKAYPPTPGKKITAVFEQTEGEDKRLVTYLMEVRKEPDTLALGSCNYKVLRIDRSRLDDKSRPVFVNTDYYAPELRLILAKEFPDRSGRMSLNKYDKIYPVPR